MKIIRISAAIGAALLIALVVSAPSLVEYIAFKNLPPAQEAKARADYQAWKTKRITLPAEALEAKPYTPETKAAAHAFEEAWQKQGMRAEEILDNFFALDLSKPQPTLEEQQRELAEVKPLLDAFDALINRPDYRLGATVCHLVQDKGGLPYPDFLMSRTGVKLLRMKARILIREGNLKEALASAEEAMRAGWCGSYDSLLTQLISIEDCSIGLGAWNDVLLKCDDPALLHEMQDRQQRLAGRMRYLGDSTMDPLLFDPIGFLLELKRRGYETQYQNLTGREISGRCKATLAMFLEKEGLPAVNQDRTADPQLPAIIRERIRTYREEASSRDGQAHGLGGLWRRYQDSIATPLQRSGVLSVNEITTRSQLLLSRFDLLRLATAGKLYALEHGKAPEKMADLVPAYLPAPLPDRLARSKAVYPAKEARFYSVGPDGKDDGLQITYDPSNGTVSGGDVALKR